MVSKRRRLEKNYLGLSHVFSANLSYILSNILYRKFPIRTYKWFKTAENTEAKFPMNYIRQIIAQISQKMQRKTYRKFLVYYIVVVL